MTMRAVGGSRRASAPALRFLFVCLGGWVLLRMMMLWNPAVPVVPDAAKAPWTPPSPFAAPTIPDPLPHASIAHASLADNEWLPRPAVGTGKMTPSASPWLPPTPRDAVMVADAGGGDLDSERHSLRLALIARLFPSAARVAAVPGVPLAWAERSPVTRAEPGRGGPFWMQRSLDGWSLGGWLYLRDGSARVPGGIAVGGQLGGSQGGVRLAYGFGDEGRLRAYGRATMAIEQPTQRELAVGLAYAPVARLPLDVAIEQRVAVGRAGRTALAAMVVGGVSDVELPAGFRLDAYAQAGVVGARRRDGFADGTIVIDRRLGANERSSLRLGALAAGAVQPGVARVDVGPRLTVRLPEVGQGGRIALDWRHRVAGDARPESGLALTLAADF